MALYRYSNGHNVKRSVNNMAKEKMVREDKLLHKVLLKKVSLIQLLYTVHGHVGSQLQAQTLQSLHEYFDKQLFALNSVSKIHTPLKMKFVIIIIIIVTFTSIRQTPDPSICLIARNQMNEKLYIERCHRIKSISIWWTKSRYCYQLRWWW